MGRAVRVESHTTLVTKYLPALGRAGKAPDAQDLQPLLACRCSHPKFWPPMMMGYSVFMLSTCSKRQPPASVRETTLRGRTPRRPPGQHRCQPCPKAASRGTTPHKAAQPASLHSASFPLASPQPAPPRSGWGTGHRAGRRAHSCPASRTCRCGQAGRNVEAGCGQGSAPAWQQAGEGTATQGTLDCRHGGANSRGQRQQAPSASLVGLGGHQGQVLGGDDLVGVNVLRWQPGHAGYARAGGQTGGAAGGRRRGGGGARGCAGQRTVKPGGCWGGRVSLPAARNAKPGPASSAGRLTSLVMKHLPRILRGPPCRSTLACTTRRAALHPARRLLEPRANCTLARLHALLACIAAVGALLAARCAAGRGGGGPMGLAARRECNGWGRTMQTQVLPSQHAPLAACVLGRPGQHVVLGGAPLGLFLVAPGAAGEAQPPGERRPLHVLAGRARGAAWGVAARQTA